MTIPSCIPAGDLGRCHLCLEGCKMGLCCLRGRKTRFRGLFSIEKPHPANNSNKSRWIHENPGCGVGCVCLIINIFRPSKHLLSPKRRNLLPILTSLCWAGSCAHEAVSRAGLRMFPLQCASIPIRKERTLRSLGGRRAPKRHFCGMLHHGACRSTSNWVK